MYLNQSIPFLYGTPGALGSRRAIVYSIFTLGFALFFYLAAEIWKSFPFFGLMTLLIGMHGYVAVASTSANLLYVLRYFLVWILIILTAFVWYWYAGEVLVAPFGVAYQTEENTRVLVLAGTFSLCGSLMGWHVSLLRFNYRRYSVFYIARGHRKLLTIGGIVLAVGFALLYVWAKGGIVGIGGSYTDKQQGFEHKFNVFNIFQYIGISMLLIIGARANRIQLRYLVFAIITLILGMLAGSRADYLPQAFVLMMLVSNRRVVDILARKQYGRLIKGFVIGVAILILFYFVASFIAVWRYGVSPAHALNILLESDRGLLIRDHYGHRMLWIETGNMMLGTFYSALVQAREGFTGFLWGESYFNYLLRSPPAFLGLPRPLGLDSLVSINGETMAQGGIFEVAEAYWNYGLIGCLVVSFFISYAFGWLLKRGLKYNSYFFLTWYLVFGFMGVRAVWYQTFTYFRIMTVMLVIYLIVRLAFKWFLVGDKRLLLNRPKFTIHQ